MRASVCVRVRVSVRQPISARLLPLQFPLWPTGLHWSAVLQLQLRRVSKLLIYPNDAAVSATMSNKVRLRTAIAVVNLYIRLESCRGSELVAGGERYLLYMESSIFGHCVMALQIIKKKEPYPADVCKSFLSRKLDEIQHQFWIWSR